MSKDRDSHQLEYRREWFARGFQDGYNERQPLRTYEAPDGYFLGYSHGSQVRDFERFYPKVSRLSGVRTSHAGHPRRG